MTSLDLEKYHIKISNLNPLDDSKSLYDKVRWSNLNSSYKELVSDFEDEEISRLDIIKAFKEYYDGNDICMRAFLLSMIWGFSNTGYGTHRTNKYISEPSNILLIKQAIDFVKSNNLKLAFKSLKKIKGLGVSYITKILYFASRSIPEKKDYALIYDIRVASALVELTTPKEIFEIITVNPPSKFSDYIKYNDVIHIIANKYELEPEKIEMFLFNRDFD